MEFVLEETSYNGTFVSVRYSPTTRLPIYRLEHKCIPEGFNSSNAVIRVNCIAKNKCDTQNDPAKIEDTFRVAGGTEATARSNPWLVAVFVNGTFQCGGTIISERWVKINFSYHIEHSKPMTKEKLYIYIFCIFFSGIDCRSLFIEHASQTTF